MDKPFRINGKQILVILYAVSYVFLDFLLFLQHMSIENICMVFLLNEFFYVFLDGLLVWQHMDIENICIAVGAFEPRRVLLDYSTISILKRSSTISK